VIAYREFAKSFGAHRAVDGVTLEIGEGEVVALLGPNGSGKTTCLKAAAGLVRPTSGTVLLDGRAAEAAGARRAIAYLPQKVAFPAALTGREVVEFFRALRGVDPARTDEALRFASLNGAGARPVGTYSGGMMQRLGLAVAILPAARALLLDEPTASLDPDGLCAFYGLVERARHEGRTVFFTSHHMGDVERLADRFAVLVRGRLAAVLTNRELADRLSDRGVLRLRLGARDEAVLRAVRALAPAALWAADELIVPGPASLRPPVIDAVRAARAEIRGLTAEEGRLDDVYRELVEGAA
jgi:Cu-processing system ATP-binding protein